MIWYYTILLGKDFNMFQTTKLHLINIFSVSKLHKQYECRISCEKITGGNRIILSSPLEY